MKKVIFALVFLLAGHVNFGQDEIKEFKFNGSHIEDGDEVCLEDWENLEVLLDYDHFSWKTFFGDCFVEYFDEEGELVGDNLQYLWVRWEVIQNGTNGSFTVLGNGDPINVALNAFSVTGLNLDIDPNWFVPDEFTIRLRGYNDMDLDTPCFEWDEEEQEHTGAHLEISLTPKNIVKKTNAWSCTIDVPGDYTYEVTNIPSWNNLSPVYTWTYPPSWSVTGSTTTNSLTLTPNGTPGTVSVTISGVDACGNLTNSCNASFSDCYYFGYSDYNFCGSTNWTSELDTDDYGDKMKFPRFQGDFNGDEKEDIIGFGNTTITVGYSDGSSFNHNTFGAGMTYGVGGWRQDKYPRMIADFNGDGMDDIVGFGQASTGVMLSTGTGFTGNQEWSTSFEYNDGYTDRNVHKRYIGDFNGDGKSDVFGIQGNSTTMGISNGVDAFVVTPWVGAEGLTPGGSGAWNDYDKWPILVANVNGDQYDDLVAIGETTVYVAVSNGTSFTVSPWMQSSLTYGVHEYTQSKFPRIIGDFNGDSFDDILGLGNTGVVVALSNGTNGFSATSWLSGLEFSRMGRNGEVDGDQYVGDLNQNSNDNFIVDYRQIGVVSNEGFIGEHDIVIADMNADGMFDLVGFNDMGTYVSYSNGVNFECPDEAPAYHNDIGYNSLNFMRSVGNFDITDDELEIIGFGSEFVTVSNCDNCPNPIAGAALNNPNFIEAEQGYQGWAVDVSHFCNDDPLILNLESTDCEDRYVYSISEFDIQSWTSTEVYNSDWVMGKAPDFVNISNDVNYVPGQLYMINFAVGPEWSDVNNWFKIDDISTNATFTMSGSPVYHSTLGSGGIWVYEVCDNLTSAYVNLLGSTCYDDWSIEVQQVNQGTAVPIGGIVYSNGPNQGQMPPYTYIPVSSYPLNAIYRVKLSITDGLQTVFTYRYFRRKACSGGGDKRRGPNGMLYSDTGQNIEITAYPNPTNGFTNLKIDGEESGEDVTIEVYNSLGQKVYEKISHKRLITLELSGLEDGIYFTKVAVSGFVETIRIVKN